MLHLLVVTAVLLLTLFRFAAHVTSLVVLLVVSRCGEGACWLKVMVRASQPAGLACSALEQHAPPRPAPPCPALPRLAKQSVGSGIVGGAVGLVTAPVIGAANDGISGFAMGVATGASVCWLVFMLACIAA